MTRWPVIRHLRWLFYATVFTISAQRRYGDIDTALAHDYPSKAVLLQMEDIWHGRA